MAQRTAGGNAAFHNFHNDFAHIADPNERRRLALAEIDKAPFGWYHVRTCVVAGVGFFTDAYDIFAINLVTPMLGFVYFHGKIPEHADTGIKVATSGGTVIGQLGFGYLADVVGRKKMYGLELLVIIVATLGQAISGSSSAVTITGVLIFWRVMMGIGIGGDYPLSSIITSEFATTRWRGAMMGAVFAMQGFGQFGAALVSLCSVSGFKESMNHTTDATKCGPGTPCGLAVDKTWRIIIGFGAVPAVIALYYRLTIPETPRYTFDISRDVEKGSADSQAFVEGRSTGDREVDEIRQVQQKNNEEYAPPKASWADFWGHYSQWKHGKILIGTAGSWFLLDVAFYGLGLNNSIILSAIGYSNKKGYTVYKTLFNNATGNLILVCCGAIPGYWGTVATCDTIGRKPIQLLGFVMLTILFIIIGFAYDHLSSHALLALYVLCQFFFNFGPNATTFIVPGECFPTRYRSTSHGISAASGKVGAIIAQVLIGPLRTRKRPAAKDQNSPWLNHVMQIFAAFMFAGIFTTILIPETKRKTLEELAGELHGERADGTLEISHRNDGSQDSPGISEK
jgi:PHS family inorganic phosphate transporter-like MFS transporter